MKKYILILISYLILSGCVSNSKFHGVVDENKQLNNELKALKYVNEQNKKLVVRLKNEEQQKTETEAVLFEINNKYNGLKQQHESLQSNYDKMLLRNKKLLERAFADKTNLTEELIEKQAQLNKKELALNRLEKDLSNQKTKLELSQKNILGRQARIDSLNNLLSLSSTKLSKLKLKINSLLIGYSNDEIAIEERADGRLHISLSQDLLFKKGSDQLDWKGKSAIQKLARALNTDQSIQIIVEGHTDSDGTPSRNWELSTDRALAVVQVLVNSNILPGRIIASGRGQHAPLLPNTSKINKSKNRRTEIILSPNLEGLMQLLNTD